MNPRIISSLFLAAFVSAAAAQSEPVRPSLDDANLKFSAYSGSLATREKMEFQISGVGRNPQFVKIGNVIAGTTWKLENFVFRKSINKSGVKEDLSRLILRNTVDGTEVFLPLSGGQGAGK